MGISPNFIIESIEECYRRSAYDKKWEKTPYTRNFINFTVSEFNTFLIDLIVENREISNIIVKKAQTQAGFLPVKMFITIKNKDLRIVENFVYKHLVEKNYSNEV